MLWAFALTPARQQKNKDIAVGMGMYETRQGF